MVGSIALFGDVEVEAMGDEIRTACFEASDDVSLGAGSDVRSIASFVDLFNGVFDVYE